MNQLLSVLANLSKQLGPKEFEASLKNIMKLLQNGADFDSVIKSLKLNGKDFSKQNQQLLEAAALLKSKEGKINMNDRAVEALAISEAAADEKDKKAKKIIRINYKKLYDEMKKKDGETQAALLLFGGGKLAQSNQDLTGNFETWQKSMQEGLNRRHDYFENKSDDSFSGKKTPAAA